MAATNTSAQKNNQNIAKKPSIFKDLTRNHLHEDGSKTEYDHYEAVSRTINDDEWIEITNEPSLTEEQKYLQKYAAAEHLAHGLVYQKLPDSSIQQLQEEDGNIREYQCTRIKTKHEGLVGYIFSPTVVLDNETPDIKVIFRGTDPASYACHKRNIELQGAGSLSFAANANSILCQINESLKEFNQLKNPNNNPVSITFGGHSLGGADAQNALNVTLNALCAVHGLAHKNTYRLPCPAKEQLDQLSAVTKVRMFSFNAAGVPNFTAKQCAASTAKLANHYKADGSKVLEIESYNQRVGGDGVQQTGDAHILNNAPKEHAKVDVLKAHIGHEHRNKFSLPITLAAIGAGVLTGGVAGLFLAGGAIAGGVTGLLVASGAAATSGVLGIADTGVAHTKKIYKEPIKASYERLSNDTPEGQKQVHAELSKKNWLTNALHKGAGMLFGFEKHKKSEKDAKIKEVANQSAFKKPVEATLEAHPNLLQRIFGHKKARI